MATKAQEIYEQTKSFTDEERDELFRLLFDDLQLREDMIDMALVMEAEAESSESVTLDELLAGKRSYYRN